MWCAALSSLAVAMGAPLCSALRRSRRNMVACRRSSLGSAMVLRLERRARFSWLCPQMALAGEAFTGSSRSRYGQLSEGGVLHLDAPPRSACSALACLAAHCASRALRHSLFCFAMRRLFIRPRTPPEPRALSQRGWRARPRDTETPRRLPAAGAPLRSGVPRLSLHSGLAMQ